MRFIVLAFTLCALGATIGTTVYTQTASLSADERRMTEFIDKENASALAI